MIVDRLVRVLAHDGQVIAEGKAVAEGLPGVLVREPDGKQCWWPDDWVVIADVAGGR